MIVFAVLVAVFAVASLIPARGGRRSAPDAARWAMAVAMAFAGASHLLMPTPFIQHLPEFVPFREAIIAGSGVVEIVLGIGLIGPTRYRQAVALALAAYLVAVFPANVYVAVAAVAVDGQPGGWMSWFRLPFQAVFIAWALWSVPGTVDFGRSVVRRLTGPHRVPATVSGR
jgi:uncharacterized membrane protein